MRAAGGVVRRASDGAVLLVHRPRYDDWSFPKGKLDAGESFEDAARREVEEETGLRCALGRELSPVEYVDHQGRPKLVRYWLMAESGDDAFVPNDEVDEIRWCGLAAAVDLLSYEHDRELARGLLGDGHRP